METTRIHPTAIVHPGSVIGEGTEIGPYSIIDDKVIIGKNCRLQEHVVVRAHTTLGDEVKIFPHSVIGSEPQHLRHRGEPTTTVVGNRVVFREFVTVHSGTAFSGGTTTIGDDCYFMVGCHVAHDCTVGRNVIAANQAHFGGHSLIEDFSNIGGITAINQFCRVGRYAFVGSGSMIRKDLPPFMVGKGNDFEVQGVNTIGLQRNGFSPKTITRMRKIYKIFYLQKLTVPRAIEKILVELGETDEVKVFIDFIKGSKMGFLR